MPGEGTFGFGKTSSKSKSRSEFGLNQAQRTQSFNEFFPFFQQIPNFIEDFRSVSAPQLDLGASGLTNSQETMFQRLLAPALRNQTSLVSAGNAIRGQVSPFNLSGIADSAGARALTNLGPQAFNQASQNQLFNVTAPFESMMKQLQTVFQGADAISKLFQGGSSKGKGSSGGFQFSGSGGVL